MRKQLTGEPVAGEPHSGFGGRGRRAPFPTPIQGRQLDRRPIQSSDRFQIRYPPFAPADFSRPPRPVMADGRRCRSNGRHEPDIRRKRQPLVLVQALSGSAAVKGGRSLLRLLCSHHCVGRILPTIRWRVMRTFTPAAHKCASRAGTRDVIIVPPSAPAPRAPFLAVTRIPCLKEQRSRIRSGAILDGGSRCADLRIGISYPPFAAAAPGPAPCVSCAARCRAVVDVARTTRVSGTSQKDESPPAIDMRELMTLLSIVWSYGRCRQRDGGIL